MFTYIWQVQGKAEPPVCKIMDFHKEKYQKKLREKDRAKVKVLYSVGFITLYCVVAMKNQYAYAKEWFWQILLGGKTNEHY